MSRLRSCAAALAVAAAAGCAGDGAPPACPAVKTVPDAGRLVDFAGDKQTPSARRFVARITNAAIACRRVERNDRPALAAEVKVQLTTESGPALEAEQVRYRYFLAIVDGDDTVIARKSFPVTVAMPGGGAARRTTETLSPTWPLAENASGDTYTVYLGFELSKDQVRYNRANPS